MVNDFRLNMIIPIVDICRIVKGIQAIRIDFFLYINVANIRCFILIKCSEQEARFKKICYNVVISEKNSHVCW